MCRNITRTINTSTRSGLRIFDASKVTGLDRLALKNMKFGRFEASVQDKVINVRFNLVAMLRNRFIPLFSDKENYVEQITVPLGSTVLEDFQVVVAGIGA
jgi:hypothetical protein